jgi:hypothetical protein
MADGSGGSNAGSHVNRIPGVTLDESGFIHTPYGSYHPATGEGSPIDAPKELMRQILIALIRDGEESGPAAEFDWDEFKERKSGG